jgi:hypothetical protein
LPADWHPGIAVIDHLEPGTYLPHASDTIVSMRLWETAALI